jgi:putative ABC transport system permease protein
MSLFRLIRRSLGFYWRTNLAVLLSATVTTAVLTGALVVGDSVRHSLKMMAAARLGTTQLALVPQNRFFRAELADELAAQLDTVVAPVLQLRGLVADSDGEKRANRIEVLGVDERFFKVGGGGNPFGWHWSEGTVLNEPLAARLSVEVGDEVVLRVEKPGLMPRDVPLVPDSDLSTAFRLAVRAVAGQSAFGRFNLQANHVAPLNVYVPMQWLQEKLGRAGRANMLLVASRGKDGITVEGANEAVSKHWQLADAGLELRELKRAGMLEIRSTRIFIEESLAWPAMRAADGAVGVLTYFVNEFRLDDRTTPYSMVTAMERSAGAGGLIPKDMQDDEILINQWLAKDLGADVEDVIELTYFVFGRMNKLQEAKSSFRVRGILPMEGPALDPELMPDFPGLADADNCRDWEPGVPIDLDKIRKRDEDYWDRYRGTPKAFVTLEAGQAMWANRYGKLTAVRYVESRTSKEAIAPRLLSAVNPASVGLYFQSVRERGLKAGDEATDFGQLFLGLSMFITVAALVLMGLVFVFGVENRSEQVGMLLAVGFSPKVVKRLLFIEGGILAVLGAVAGTVGGLLYTKAMIYGLSTVWQAAVAGSTIDFYAKTSTLCKGAVGAVVVSLIAVWLTLRKQAARSARELLAGNVQWQFFAGKRVSKGGIGLAVAAVAAVAAVVVLAVVGSGDSASVSGAFFGAGALLLIAGLALCQALLRIMQGRWNRPMASLAGLGLRNSTRRSGRSLAVVGLLACGVFLVIAVGANERDPLAQADSRDSGTGGFALFGESAIGILHDLNSDSGRKSLGLDEGDLAGVRIVQLRVNEGDDASCLNLNRAQRPRLLGVRPEQLQERGAFGFAKTIKETRDKRAWELLNSDLGEDVVPAVGDYATVIWALGKSVPDELEYTDEKGRKFRLRLVGMLKNSILQGSLIISEDEFVKRFPSEDGYRVFLIDAQKDKTEVVTATLSTALRDFGLALTPARQRLAAFSKVENTYLSIFRLLGGLGLVLGSLGLGLVVLRNILERRGELAMLRAVGFDKSALKKMVFCEHWGLMASGLACGVVAALVAVAPALRTPGTNVPYLSLLLTIVGIAIGGAVWVRLATRFALGGKLLEALRNE